MELQEPTASFINFEDYNKLLYSIPTFHIGTDIHICTLNYLPPPHHIPDIRTTFLYHPQLSVEIVT